MTVDRYRSWSSKAPYPKETAPAQELFNTSSCGLKKRQRKVKVYPLLTSTETQSSSVSVTETLCSLNVCVDEHRQNYCTVVKPLQWTQAPEHCMAVSCLLENATSYCSKPNYFKYHTTCEWHKNANPTNMKHTCSKVHNNLPFITV